MERWSTRSTWVVVLLGLGVVILFLPIFFPHGSTSNQHVRLLAPTADNDRIHHALNQDPVITDRTFASAPGRFGHALTAPASGSTHGAFSTAISGTKGLSQGQTFTQTPSSSTRNVSTPVERPLGSNVGAQKGISTQTVASLSRQSNTSAARAATQPTTGFVAGQSRTFAATTPATGAIATRTTTQASTALVRGTRQNRQFVASKTPASSATATTTTGATVPVHGQSVWAVQLGSFRESANAQHLVQRLKAHGFSAVAIPYQDRGQTWIRVVVPSHESHAQMNTLRRSIASTLGVQGFVVMVQL